ncbi:MAG: hypothetical protein ABI790_00250 [Betaproteobacteria bacterium]
MPMKNLIALFFSIMLAACALDPKRIDAPPETRILVQPATPSPSDQLLSHLADLRKLETREIAAERDNARSQFLRDRSDVSRIRYALLWAMGPFAPGTPVHSAAQDDADLIGLVEPLIADGTGGKPSAGPEIRALAMLLHNVVNERRKVREQLRDTQARLALARKDDVRDAEARALRTRVEELEAKLNALKSIDRSVNRRAESTRK